MRQDYFQFKPTHSFFILVNDRPNIVGTDESIWRRLKLIPFTVHFSKEERDEDLKEKLVAEAEGILNWLVKGAVRWFENGIDYPAIVEAAGSEYQADMDAFGQFLKECTQRANGQKVASAKLLEYYHRWCDANGVMFKPDHRWLSKEMPQRGYEKKRSAGSWWLGIEVLPEVIDQLSYSSGDNGQVPNRQTHTGRGNEQVVQVDSLYAREEGNLSDNGFHLFTCSDVETFNGFDLDKRRDILVRQYWSAGAYRQDLSFEEFALGETGYLSTLSGNELSGQFSENLDLLKSMGKIEIS